MNHLANTTSLLALVAAAVPATAQTTPTDTASPSAANAQDSQQATAATIDPNEIIVTATRRAERLQDVPTSIAAFGVRIGYGF